MLQVFFSLPYSTDLDGKDAEKLIRIVKEIEGPISRRKELFDIVDGSVGYSVKTLFKKPAASRVDLQEQRFCDKKELEALIAAGESAHQQGELLLRYMMQRIESQMAGRGISTAISAILLKYWNADRTYFQIRYWEEDFLGFVTNLWNRHVAGEIEWVLKPAGLHGQDKTRGNVRLLRMHPKHNQIFTDHDIPYDALKIEFQPSPVKWEELHDLLFSGPG
jgi:hypothetical protein